MGKRIACIDLGTNAIRFIVYEFFSLEEYQVLYKHRAIIRLGAGVFSKGALSHEVLGKVPQILLEYQKKAKEFQVDTICCAATSAVREATNGQQFLNAVEQKSGLRFKALTGAQEARTLSLALQWNRPAPRNLIYAGIDIGGGSTEVFWYHNHGFIDGISMPIGTVRVLEHFCEFPLSSQGIQNIRNFVSVNAKALQSRQGTMIPHRVFGISGLLHAIFDLMAKGQDEPIAFQELEAFIDGNRDLTPPELQEKFAIERNRSEILMPGCIILSQLMVMSGFQQLFRAEVGLRDGMALENMIQQGAKFENLTVERFNEAKLDWAFGLLEKYAGDIPHAKRVEQLVAQLFHKWVELGEIQCSEDYLLVLRAAAVLHDIGHFINYTNHHNHSAYVIRQSQSPVFSDRETEWIALLAKFHRKNARLPCCDEAQKDGVSPSEYYMFSVSLVILKIADALDHQRLGLVTFQDIVLKDDLVYELAVSSENPVQLSEEKRVFDLVAPAFESVFGKSIELKVLHQASVH